MTALAFAAQGGVLACAAHAVKNGRATNACICACISPLLCAKLAAGHTEVAQLLLKRKANPLAANAKGQKPADLAKDEQVGEMLRGVRWLKRKVLRRPIRQLYQLLLQVSIGKRNTKGLGCASKRPSLPCVLCCRWSPS
jgi:hypothetical protein